MRVPALNESLIASDGLPGVSATKSAPPFGRSCSIRPDAFLVPTETLRIWEPKACAILPS